MQLRLLAVCLTMLSLTACANTPDGAICDGTAASRKALAGALLDDAGPQAQRAGLVLLEQIKAAC